jgi:hypothetical protein
MRNDVYHEENAEKNLGEAFVWTLAPAHEP